MARILSAEDGILSRKSVATVVDRLGHSALVGPNGRHAGEALRAGNHFEPLTTDVVMPGLGGATPTRTLREDQRRAAMPSSMSAFLGVNGIAGLLELGAAWLMARPVDRIMLEDCTQRAIN